MKKYLSLLITMLIFVFLPLLPLVQAQTNPGGQTITGNPGGQTVTGNPGGCDPAKQICNPIKENTVQGFIRTVLEGVLKIGIPIVALAVIYCGFLFVAARGNSEKLTKAKDALLYTLIGAAILLGSWAIAKLISDTVLAL